MALLMGGYAGAYFAYATRCAIATYAILRFHALIGIREGNVE